MRNVKLTKPQVAKLNELFELSDKTIEVTRKNRSYNKLVKLGLVMPHTNTSDYNHIKYTITKAGMNEIGITKVG